MIRKFIIVLFITFCHLAAAQQDSAVYHHLTPRQAADSLIAVAKEYVGTRYHYGAQGPTAFDCSGFTSYVYRQLGITISRSSNLQATDGRAVEGPLSHLQKGDLVIFGGRRSAGAIGHVGIFMEMDPDGKSFSFIHAANGGGGKISHLNERYYQDRFLGARRILPDFCQHCPETKDTIHNTMIDKVINVPQVQSIALDSAYTIILMDTTGHWTYVTADGELLEPDSTTYIVLQGDNWRSVQHSSVIIPSLTHKKKPAQQTSTSSTSDAAAQYHTIVQGNTLSSIARRYGTSVSRLCQLNNITVNTTLRIGKKIRVK